ncbi:hypothetical protein L228DRAFT_264111 [Xylona heveae TC161]|uniref:FHA domain-containing protein n=1 Tax=Xylona heveae (strain CBS 132557 / TC161) TaxID=1328760 RepID=A0A164ZE59_XYLHT|nr:hypothetical protein L228DRAFT_264111 [Xylona heveae TC161]KZF18988.1 hypothetical protein L228DRAFT_264111 [Xylona heveae TC161]
MGDKQVSVTLTPISFEDDFPERVINLDPERTEARLGRCSKSSTKNLLAAKDNGLFESPVMSRDHAKLYIIPPSSSAVYVKDSGSMHGTAVNGMPLGRHISFPLKNGDKLRFGTAVSRGNQTFNAREVQVNIDWSKWQPPTPESSSSPTRKGSPAVFIVPDASSDSEQEVTLIASSKVTRRGIRVPEVSDSEYDDSVIEDSAEPTIEMDVTTSAERKTLRSTPLGGTHTRFDSPEFAPEELDLEDKGGKKITPQSPASTGEVPGPHAGSISEEASRQSSDMVVEDSMSALEAATPKKMMTGYETPQRQQSNEEDAFYDNNHPSWSTALYGQMESQESPGYSPEPSPKSAIQDYLSERLSPGYSPEPEGQDNAQEFNYKESDSPGYSPEHSPEPDLQLNADNIKDSPGYSVDDLPQRMTPVSSIPSPKMKAACSPLPSPGLMDPRLPKQHSDSEADSWLPSAAEIAEMAYQNSFYPNEVNLPNSSRQRWSGFAKRPMKDITTLPEFLSAHPERAATPTNQTISRMTIGSLVHQTPSTENGNGDISLSGAQADSNAISSVKEELLPQSLNERQFITRDPRLIRMYDESKLERGLWETEKDEVQGATYPSAAAGTQTEHTAAYHLEKETPNRISIKDIVNYPSPPKTKRKADQISESVGEDSLLNHGGSLSSQDSVMQDAQPRDFPLSFSDIEIFVPLNGGTQTSSSADQSVQTHQPAPERAPKRRKTTHTWRRSFLTHALTAFTSAVIGGAGVFFGLLALPESNQ